MAFADLREATVGKVEAGGKLGNRFGLRSKAVDSVIEATIILA